MPEIIDVAQNSAEWLLARAGLPTCSEYATLLAKGRGGGDSVTRKKLVNVKAGELFTGAPAESFSNAHMERGHAMEQEAADRYAFEANADLQVVGFIKRGRTGGSPDRLIGNNGILEIKTKLPAILIDVIKADEFPSEHKAQCQGLLMVSEREWIDLCCYWPGMPYFVKRAYRDEAYIKTLTDAVDAFNDEVDAVLEMLRKYRAA
jgi:YqaJ-like viral recombinase domain